MSAIPADCTCTDHCPESPSDNQCAHCRKLDIYYPCPVIGFGCGLDCGDDEHCTPEQQAAADGKTPPDVLTIYPHTIDGGLDCIIDGEGTMRTLAEADGLAWNKALTDSELAAEYWQSGYADVRYGREDEDLEPIPEIILRFASLPHYDELP